MYRALLFLSLVYSILSGCVPAGSISNQNFSPDYHEDGKYFHTDFTVFHFSPDSSRLFIRVNTSEFLFAKQEEDTFRAAFEVRLRILESYESPVVKVNFSQAFNINKTLEGAGKRIYSVNFPQPPAGQYIMECTITDLHKRVSDQNYVNLDNSSPQSRQNFFFHRENGIPYFTNYLSSTDTFNVDYRNEKPQVVIVKYYNREFELAAPPYSFHVPSQFNYNPDSVFTITTGLNNRSNREGATIFRFPDGFPAITTPGALIAPLRYISSRKEFEEIKSATNKKQASDRFWLDIGSNQERSRQLIKKYYSRVEKANHIFTSYTEGWRTDRGMIYIIFGSPHAVYKSSNSESWTYGEANSSLSVTFNFTRENNPFTDNDFILERAPLYETTWYHGVETWRQGRVYNDF